MTKGALEAPFFVGFTLTERLEAGVSECRLRE